VETQQLETPGGARLAWARPRAASRREVARGLLRELLATEFGDVAFEQECAVCGSREHGPLRAIAPAGARVPRVSVSYAGPVAVVAVAPLGIAEFGIDAEADSPRTRAAIAEALPDSPDPSIRAWTALEAVAKARGTGLRGDWQRADARGFDLEHVTLPAGPGGPDGDRWPIVVALAARTPDATPR
jgi:phosphopantetheinyl transferase